ncbi:MAG: hypothetical protein CMP28_10165 [Roseibacillus sp.]|nr:hypothetical protein [Roseibacillus sp.]
MGVRKVEHDPKDAPVGLGNNACPRSFLWRAGYEAMNRAMKLKGGFVVLGMLSLMGVASPGAEENTTNGPAVTPQPRVEEWWFKRHAEKIGAMKEGEYELLMVGDSITHNFESIGEKVWKKYFEPLKALNLGFGGDRTNHVLWRLGHLPKPKAPPKAAVVMIGTNNICWGSDKPREAADGVKAIAAKLHALYPEAKILVLGVFPRRRELSHPHRKQIIELNSYLPELLKDLKNVKFLDIGPSFLDEKGHLSKEMMPDTTHPSEKGHEVWAQAIEGELKAMLGR